MNSPDPFGFAGAATDEPTGLDITAFAPQPRPVDRTVIAASREVARDNGFTRRASSAPPAAEPATATRGSKRRVTVSEILGLQDRYPDTERMQLNMLAPVPVALRWRALVQARQVPAWEILDAAMNALEARSPGETPTIDAA